MTNIVTKKEKINLGIYTIAISILYSYIALFWFRFLDVTILVIVITLMVINVIMILDVVRKIRKRGKKK